MQILPKQIKQDREKLIQWYQKNKRTLPWRASRDPYKIWISEVMLQQTTVTAVLPFYEKFMNRFPSVKSLAKASLEDVYEYWAGLGYYSRARNLHKAAQLFAEKGFPQKADELIEFPGLGPYTSRAVSSLAFNEKVGVLDGNVIRILCRKYGLKLKWWEPSEKNKLQIIADELAQTEFNADLNQGMMELGATVCTPKKVMCLLCPWNKDCVSYKENLVESIPLKKPKDKFQIWKWDFEVIINQDLFYLEPNQVTPFLKENLLPLSKAKLLNQKPKDFHFKHGVTKYDIYVSVQTKKAQKSKKDPGLWAKKKELVRLNPTSLMKKIVAHIEKSDKLKK